jgi:hypothetical protein
MSELGPFEIASIAIAAVVVLGVAALVLRVAVFGRRKGRKHERIEHHGDGRIAVLETTDIDERRKLVLVRCDDVEHLIVVGGPADLLVESDVRKTRPQSAAPRTPAPTPLQPAASATTPASPLRVPSAMGASLDAAIAAAVPKGSSDTTRASARPTEPRPPLPARSGPAPMTPRPAGRNSEAPAARASTTDLTRRETASPRRATPQAQLPARHGDVPRPQGGERFPRGNTRGEEANGLPTAKVPWPETDSIEDEIVQALRFDPQRGADAPAGRREPAPAKPVVDSSATLGDLADRLEEALAREIGTAAPPPRRTEPEPAEAPKSVESDRAKRVRERQEKRERSEPRQSTPAAEPARETPQPERREEAPVISLNARRREAADPLEDEMARLLGELTGDTKGR